MQSSFTTSPPTVPHDLVSAEPMKVGFPLGHMTYCFRTAADHSIALCSPLFLADLFQVPGLQSEVQQITASCCIPNCFRLTCFKCRVCSQRYSRFATVWTQASLNSCVSLCCLALWDLLLVVDVDGFYIVLFSALEQTHCAHVVSVSVRNQSVYCHITARLGVGICWDCAGVVFRDVVGLCCGSL